MVEGIYILANDVVYDQLIALLNSIRCHAGQPYPVCIIPYDHQIAQVRQLIATWEGVSILEDEVNLQTWEDFAADIWATHPSAYATWQAQGITGVNRLGMHRRFCAFDGPFDRFIYLDADTLVLSPLAPLFAPLAEVDWVVYDFQSKDPTHVFNVGSARLDQVFAPDRVATEIFCAGMYAAHKGLFKADSRAWLLSQLAAGDAEILYMNAPDQSILNYMVMKSQLKQVNLARSLPVDQVTGCCVTSPHFQQRGDRLFDKDVPLTYLHYIGLSSKLFTRLCAGENLDFPYRDLFLHYRYLQATDQRPKFVGKPVDYRPRPTLRQRLARKIGLSR